MTAMQIVIAIPLVLIGAFVVLNVVGFVVNWYVGMSVKTLAVGYHVRGVMEGGIWKAVLRIESPHTRQAVCFTKRTNPTVFLASIDRGYLSCYESERLLRSLDRREVGFSERGCKIVIDCGRDVNRSMQVVQAFFLDALQRDPEEDVVIKTRGHIDCRAGASHGWDDIN